MIIRLLILMRRIRRTIVGIRYIIKSSYQNGVNYLNVYNLNGELMYKCELFKIIHNDDKLLDLIIRYNIN